MAANEISKLSVLLLFNTEQFETQLSKVQIHTKKAGANLQRIGQKLSLGLSLPLAAAGKQITDTATSFEYQMARVQAISGATAQSFNSLQKNAEELGASTIYQATAVGQLQEEYAKLGFSASEITAVTESTLSLAQVTGSDLGRAAEIAGSTLRIFGKDVSEVGQVNDVIAVAISQSALDFEAFAETMKYAGSDAAIAGVSLEELGAAMGVLANRGVKSSIAGTRLRMIFAKLAKEGGNTHEKFIELINGSVTMTEAIKRFGVRAAAAVPVLQQNKEEFFALENSMRQAAGTLDGMQEVMDDTSFAVQRRLISALENLAIQFGKVLLPIVNFVIEALIKVTGGFSRLPNAIKVVLVAIGTAMVVIPPFLFLLGTVKLMLVDLQMQFPKTALAIEAALGPVGLLVAAVTLLTIGIAEYLLQGKDVVTLQERINDANASAAEEAGKVLQPLRTLIAEYENENTTMARKQAILGELERSQPSYFSNLSTETTTVADLTTAYEKLNGAIKETARTRAIQSQLTKIAGEQATAIGEQVKAELELEQIARRKAAGEKGFADEQRFVPNKSGVGGFFTTFDPTADRTKELGKIISDQQAVFDALQDQANRLQSMMISGDGTLQGLFKYLQSFASQSTGGGGGGAGAGEVVSDLDKILNRLSQSLSVINEKSRLLGTDGLTTAKAELSAFNSAFASLVQLQAKGGDIGDNLQSVTDNIKRLTGVIGDEESLYAVSDALTKYNTQIEQLGDNLGAGFIDSSAELNGQIAAQKSLINTLIPILGAENEIVQALVLSYTALVALKKKNNEDTENANIKQEASNRLAASGANIIKDFGARLGEAASSSKTFGQQLVAGLKEAVLATLNLAFAQLVQNALNPENPANQASFGLAGLGALALGMGILTGLINSINVPALAQGGITTGPMLAMVGDNRSGKEAIIPLEKLPALMGKMGGGTRVYGQLSGYDIALSSDRSGKRFQRISR